MKIGDNNFSLSTSKTVNSVEHIARRFLGLAIQILGVRGFNLEINILSFLIINLLLPICSPLVISGRPESSKDGMLYKSNSSFGNFDGSNESRYADETEDRGVNLVFSTEFRPFPQRSLLILEIEVDKSLMIFRYHLVAVRNSKPNSRESHRPT